MFKTASGKTLEEIDAIFITHRTFPDAEHYPDTGGATPTEDQDKGGFAANERQQEFASKDE